MPSSQVPDPKSPDRAHPANAGGAAELAAHTRIGQGVLALAVASAGLLVAAMLVADAPLGAGGAHPAVAQMQHGGPSAERGGALLAVGAMFGIAQIAFFGLCFALGMRRREGLGALRAPLWLGLVLYVAVWMAVVVSYGSYAAAPAEAGRWLGLPIPTAILLFGFWPFPVYFVVLYLRFFESHVLSDAALETFRARVAQQSPPAGPEAAD